jgi:hypothetical protein
MRISLSAEKISVPISCICCGQKPDQEFEISLTKTRGKKKISSTTRTLAFPSCSTCMAHAKAIRQARRFMISFMILGALILISSFNSRNTLFWVLLLISGLLFFVYGISAGLGKLKQARALKHPTCAGDDPKKLISYIDWHSRTKVLEVRSEPYAFALMAANKTKLLNTPIQILTKLNEYIRANQGLNLGLDRPVRQDQSSLVTMSPDLLASQQGPSSEMETGIEKQEDAFAARLSRLEELHLKGIITSAEYHEQRTSLIGKG